MGSSLELHGTVSLLFQGPLRQYLGLDVVKQQVAEIGKKIPWKANLSLR